MIQLFSIGLAAGWSPGSAECAKDLAGSGCQTRGFGQDFHGPTLGSFTLEPWNVVQWVHCRAVGTFGRFGAEALRL